MKRTPYPFALIVRSLFSLKYKKCLVYMSVILIALLSLSSTQAQTVSHTETSFQREYKNVETLYDQYRKAIDNKQSEEARIFRNRVIEIVIALIDDDYSNFKLHFEQHMSSDCWYISRLSNKDYTRMNFSQNILEILGEPKLKMKRFKRYPATELKQAIIDVMESSRARIRTRIFRALSEFGVDSYSMKMALADLIQYRNAGTLTKGIGDLLLLTRTELRKAKDDARMEVQRLK